MKGGEHSRDIALLAVTAALFGGCGRGEPSEREVPPTKASRCVKQVAENSIQIRGAVNLRIPNEEFDRLIESYEAVCQARERAEKAQAEATQATRDFIEEKERQARREGKEPPRVLEIPDRVDTLMQAAEEAQIDREDTCDQAAAIADEILGNPPSGTTDAEDPCAGVLYVVDSDASLPFPPASENFTVQS